VGATLPPASGDDLVRRAGPVEPSDLDLLADDERREWTRDVLLEHDQEGPVLLVLPVRVN
jgi:hypothetical protein